MQTHTKDTNTYLLNLIICDSSSLFIQSIKSPPIKINLTTIHSSIFNNNTSARLNHEETT